MTYLPRNLGYCFRSPGAGERAVLKIHTRFLKASGVSFMRGQLGRKKGKPEDGSAVRALEQMAGLYLSLYYFEVSF